jgi:hypothetical protein
MDIQHREKQLERTSLLFVNISLSLLLGNRPKDDLHFFETAAFGFGDGSEKTDTRISA